MLRCNSRSIARKKNTSIWLISMERRPRKRKSAVPRTRDGVASDGRWPLVGSRGTCPSDYKKISKLNRRSSLPSLTWPKVQLSEGAEQAADKKYFDQESTLDALLATDQLGLSFTGIANLLKAAAIIVNYKVPLVSCCGRIDCLTDRSRQRWRFRRRQRQQTQQTK